MMNFTLEDNHNQDDDIFSMPFNLASEAKREDKEDEFFSDHGDPLSTVQPSTDQASAAKSRTANEPSNHLGGFRYTHKREETSSFHFLTQPLPPVQFFPYASSIPSFSNTNPCSDVFGADNQTDRDPLASGRKSSRRGSHISLFALSPVADPNFSSGDGLSFLRSSPSGLQKQSGSESSSPNVQLFSSFLCDPEVQRFVQNQNIHVPAHAAKNEKSFRNIVDQIVAKLPPAASLSNVGQFLSPPTVQESSPRIQPSKPSPYMERSFGSSIEGDVVHYAPNHYIQALQSRSLSNHFDNSTASPETSPFSPQNLESASTRGSVTATGFPPFFSAHQQEEHLHGEKRHRAFSNSVDAMFSAPNRGEESETATSSPSNSTPVSAVSSSSPTTTTSSTSQESTKESSSPKSSSKKSASPKAAQSKKRRSSKPLYPNAITEDYLSETKFKKTNFNVHVKPARRLNTDYANEFPESLCSKPYKYLLAVHTDSTKTTPFKFFLTIQETKDSAKFVQLSNVEHSSISGVEVEQIKHCNTGSHKTHTNVLHFYIKFQETSFKNNKKLFKLNIVDTSTNSMYTSTPLRLVARRGRQDPQDSFWSRNETPLKQQKKKKKKSSAVKSSKKKSVAKVATPDDDDYVQQESIDEEWVPAATVTHKREHHLPKKRKREPSLHSTKPLKKRRR